MMGTIVNALAIVAGALIGFFIKAGIPERFKIIIMQGLGLAVALIGVKMALKTNNELIVILSLVIGALIGEAIDLDRLLQKLGEKMNTLIGNGEGDFVKGFVTSSLVYCVGAMSILGALESGLTGQHKILFAKSTLDGISSIVFGSTMGIGVLFSSISVLLYQGTITLLAGSVKAYVSEPVMAEMTAVGGLLIIGIASNILEIKQFKIANLLPAIFIAALMSGIVLRWFPNFL